MSSRSDTFVLIQRRGYGKERLIEAATLEEIEEFLEDKNGHRNRRD